MVDRVLSNVEMSEELLALGKKYVPKLRVISKADSVIHTLIGKIFKVYFTGYWTTLGYTVAHPPNSKYEWQVLAHEIVHARQAKKYTRALFSLMYALWFPLLPIFVALAIFLSPWFLIGALLSLLPFPSPYRAKFEIEGYQVSMMVYYWIGWLRDEEAAQRVAENYSKTQFASYPYYYMWPFEKVVTKKLLKAVKVAQHWEAIPSNMKDPYIEDLYQLIKSAGRLKVEE